MLAWAAVAWLDVGPDERDLQILPICRGATLTSLDEAPPHQDGPYAGGGPSGGRARTLVGPSYGSRLSRVCLPTEPRRISIRTMDLRLDWWGCGGSYGPGLDGHPTVRFTLRATSGDVGESSPGPSLRYSTRLPHLPWRSSQAPSAAWVIGVASRLAIDGWRGRQLLS